MKAIVTNWQGVVVGILFAGALYYLYRKTIHKKKRKDKAGCEKCSQ